MVLIFQDYLSTPEDIGNETSAPLELSNRSVPVVIATQDMSSAKSLDDSLPCLDTERKRCATISGSPFLRVTKPASMANAAASSCPSVNVQITDLSKEEHVEITPENKTELQSTPKTDDFEKSSVATAVVSVVDETVKPIEKKPLTGSISLHSECKYSSTDNLGIAMENRTKSSPSVLDTEESQQTSVLQNSNASSSKSKLPFEAYRDHNITAVKLDRLSTTWETPLVRNVIMDELEELGSQAQSPPEVSQISFRYRLKLARVDCLQMSDSIQSHVVSTSF